MKYIRTKDGRIIKFNTSDVEEEIAGIKYDILGFRLKTTMQFYNLQKEDIVTIADSIEELCDEFVLYYLPLEEISNNESWIPYAQYERLGVWQKMRDEIIDKTLKSKSTLYGAIWTDKGLIYVAKMNEKGELELI